jgi:hypothetical protein
MQHTPIVWNALVTKISPERKRVFSVVMGMEHGDEMKGLKCFDGKIVAAGRTFVTDYNDWYGYIAVHDSETANEIFTFKQDPGENAVFLAIGYNSSSGSVYAGGSSGWSQNPDGYSVSDNGKKLLVGMDGISLVNEQIILRNKARHNQVNDIQIVDDFMIVGGWEDGPGTHTGDNDGSLVRADGFLEVFPVVN